MTGRDPVALQAALGHTFSDPVLLRRALTHGSAEVPESVGAYERLEFLGDRVLGLVIAELLFQRYPTAEEGDLARRFNALVRKETLASIGREIDLGRYLVLGTGEEQAGGRNREAILADACEAVLGALYLDGGLDVARAFVSRLWRSCVESQIEAPRDAKTALQEWSQGGGYGLPVYREITREGPDHAPQFTIEVAVAGGKSASGSGGSKREAERIAAERLLAIVRSGGDG